eukprot:2705220-Rhodomonas_salina.2
MCTGGAGASLWAAGPRDADRTARLSGVVHEYVAPETEDDWFLSTNARSALLTPFFHFTEEPGYMDGDHVLATTDGSVKQSDETMGAGFAFAATNDAAHQGSHCCAVGGDLSSLRAEAVALDLLLDNTASDRTLVALTDSLSLMQTLEGARQSPTILVKLKAHSGIPLNEAAYRKADRGCASSKVRFRVTKQPAALLLLVTGQGGVLDFNKATWSSVVALEINMLRANGSLVTDSFLC